MIKKILLAGFALLTTTMALAQKSPVFIADGAAIHGYDAVAYFKEGKAMEGDSLLSLVLDGVKWYFVNQANLDSFKVSPEKFTPQYGGYCAYGMSAGHKAPTDPKAWMVVDGKLYFNYNKDVQQMWVKKKQELIQIADKKWPGLKNLE